MEWITNPEIWISIVTLTLLEIVLGIDNIIFISILASKLPHDQQEKARKLGLGLALITRVLLLCGLSWVVKLQKPFYTTQFLSFTIAISGRDVILILGGLFLLAKSTYEIHEKLEGEDGEVTKNLAPNFAGVIFQIMLLNFDCFFASTYPSTYGSYTNGSGLASPVRLAVMKFATSFFVSSAFSRPLDCSISSSMRGNAAFCTSRYFTMVLRVF